MKLEDLQKFWEKDIKVVLISGEIINGFFCSFDRAEGDPTGRDSIVVETDDGLISIYLDEIKGIS